MRQIERRYFQLNARPVSFTTTAVLLGPKEPLSSARLRIPHLHTLPLQVMNEPRPHVTTAAGPLTLVDLLPVSLWYLCWRFLRL
jgi:hypothetical protein